MNSRIFVSINLIVVSRFYIYAFRISDLFDISTLK